ncbi:MAG TPA: chloride channel protein [Bryobacteraceae bacterium]|nr:chloride channel protein [Bryobacteraceae bacterium]
MRLKAPKFPVKQNAADNQVGLVLSVVIGALVGLVVVAFILLTGRLAARMYPAGEAAWRRALVPALGSLFTGYLLWRFFPEARGSGIPQTKFAIYLTDGYISLKTVLGKFFCCSASLASGIALGREGPSVQIGAGIASVLGRRFGLHGQNLKALIPVGSSAALAAAFNTPIAAVLFSLEEVLGDLHAPVLGSVVLSSATSWMVLHLILGDEPLFHVPPYHLVDPAEFLVYAVLGLIVGLGSVAFVKLLLWERVWFKSLPKSTVWLQPVAGGLLVGVMGLFMPEVLGVGYDYVEKVLGGDMLLRTVVILAILKIVATASCYASGNAGGIFGPSLFMGATMGGAVGTVAHYLFPAWTATPGAYALVGMGAAFAGIVRTPLTSVIMIFEMTRDYSIIVPLMIANLISFFVSNRLQRQPIYDALAHQEGVSLPGDEMREHLSRLLVSDIMHQDPPLPAYATLDSIKDRLAEPNRRAWLVAMDGTLWGLMTRAQAATANRAQLVSDIVKPGSLFPYVHPDQPLSLALEKMGEADIDVLPVVSRADARKLLGVVTLPETLDAYGLHEPGFEMSRDMKS